MSPTCVCFWLDIPYKPYDIIVILGRKEQHDFH